MTGDWLSCIEVVGVAFLLDRVFFFGDGVAGLFNAPGRLLAVCRRFCPLFCELTARSTASAMETGDAGRFRVDAELDSSIPGTVADAGGLAKE